MFENINTYSIVDHIWSNFKHGTNHLSGVIHSIITDHFPVLYMFNYNQKKFSYLSKFRLFNESAIRDFELAVSGIDFDLIYHMQDLNAAFNTFHNKLFQCYNRFFPIKTKRVKLSSFKNHG